MPLYAAKIGDYAAQLCSHYAPIMLTLCPRYAPIMPIYALGISLYATIMPNYADLAKLCQIMLILPNYAKLCR